MSVSSTLSPDRPILEHMEILLARQPVFDRAERVVAYDVLLRSATLAGDGDGTLPEQLLVDAFLGMGVDRISEGRTVFVSVDRDVVMGGAVRVLPADRVVLQLGVIS